MKLFTLNATPVRVDVSEYDNAQRVKNYPARVAEIMQRHGFDGFTIYQVQGYWMNVPEVSFKIEIAVDKNPERVYTVAEELRDLYNQDSVMVTLPNNSVNFI